MSKPHSMSGRHRWRTCSLRINVYIVLNNLYFHIFSRDHFCPLNSSLHTFYYIGGVKLMLRNRRSTVQSTAVLLMITTVIFCCFEHVPARDDQSRNHIVPGSCEEFSSEQSSRQVESDPILVCNENRTKRAYPMDIVVFNCTVVNGGNIVDNYKVESTSIPGWNVILYPTSWNNVQVGEENDLTLTVVSGDLVNATVGKYFINVTLRSLLRPENKVTLTFTVDVLLLHILDIVASSPREGLPGGQVTHEFQINNLGNGDAYYYVWVESSDHNWVVRLLDNTQEQVYIPRGRAVIVYVTVHIPEATSAGNCQITTLCASPYGYNEEPIFRGYGQTSVEQITRIEVVKDGTHEWEVYGEPGEYTTFTFAIINRGNGLDTVIGGPGTFVISKEPQDPMKWETWIDTSDVREGGLPSGLEADIEIKVKIPSSTPVEKYTFQVDVYSDSPLIYQDFVEFIVVVKAVHKAEMNFPVSSKTGSIGENISFSSNIFNTGNIRDTYSWELESDHESWIYIQEKIFSVDYGDSHELFFHLSIPEETPAGTYEFRLMLGSLGDINISFSHMFLLNVGKTFDYSFVEPEEFYIAQINEEMLVKLRVVNTGNADIALSFDMDGEDWGILGQKNLFLRYGECKELPIYFTPKGDTPLKGHAFEITARTTMGENLTRSTTVNIMVEKFDFSITDIHIEGEVCRDSYSVKIGQINQFYTDVLNKGSKSFDREKLEFEVQVNVYRENDLIHSESILTLNKDEYHRVCFGYAFERSGQYVLEARLGDFDESRTTIRVLDDEKETTDLPRPERETYREWIYLMLIILISFVILIGSTVLIRRRYNVETLEYDAKEDYYFDGDGTDPFFENGTDIIDDLDDEEIDDEEIYLKEEKNLRYLNSLAESRFP